MKITWRTTVCVSSQGGRTQHRSHGVEGGVTRQTSPAETPRTMLNSEVPRATWTCPASAALLVLTDNRMIFWETPKQSCWVFLLSFFFSDGRLFFFGRVSALPPQQHAEFSCRASSLWMAELIQAVFWCYCHSNMLFFFFTKKRKDKKKKVGF